jgi:hypothetical protein
MNTSNFPFFNRINNNQQQQQQQQSQKFQTIYNQTSALKKDYDNTTDIEMKSALRVVLNKKIEELQTMNNVYTSTINTQIKSLVPN